MMFWKLFNNNACNKTINKTSGENIDVIVLAVQMAEQNFSEDLYDVTSESLLDVYPCNSSSLWLYTDSLS
ncbi:MAG: hypothetical protein II929_04915 [Succinivibrio sp.]|nr:hypothetical protein [Succinivibrio sp.]